MSQPEPSALSGLPEFEWDADQAARYEVAQESIGQAMAAYSALIRQAGDTGEAERLKQLRGRCSQAREALDATDADAVGQAVRHYRQLTEELRAQVR